jgi:hypothetical protein
MALAADKLKDLISIITRLLPQSSTVPPSLAADEVGVELDTGKLKVGDGSTPWDSLPYLSGGGSGATGPTGPQGATGPSGGGGGNVQVVEKVLTAADLAAMPTPVVLVTPASGKYIAPIFVVSSFNHVMDFQDGDDVSIQTQNGATRHSVIAQGNVLASESNVIFGGTVTPTTQTSYTASGGHYPIDDPVVAVAANPFSQGTGSTLTITMAYYEASL